MTSPLGDSGPTGAVLLNGLDHSFRTLGVAEASDHLIQHYFVEHVIARGGQSFGKSSCLRAVAFNHCSQSFATQMEQRRPDFHAARAARKFGRVVARITSHAL